MTSVKPRALPDRRRVRSCLIACVALFVISLLCASAFSGYAACILRGDFILGSGARNARTDPNPRLVRVSYNPMLQWHLIGFPDGSNIGSTVSCRGETRHYTDCTLPLIAMEGRQTKQRQRQGHDMNNLGAAIINGDICNLVVSTCNIINTV